MSIQKGMLWSIKYRPTNVNLYHYGSLNTIQYKTRLGGFIVTTAH